MYLKKVHLIHHLINTYLREIPINLWGLKTNLYNYPQPNKDWQLKPHHQKGVCVFFILQMMISSKYISNELSEEESFRQPNDYKIHFLEYETDSKRGGDILVTLEDPSCVVLTRNQQNMKPRMSSSSSVMAFKGKRMDSKLHQNDQELQEPLFLNTVKKESSFDIVEFCKSSQIQITPTGYIKLNPKELDRLVQFVKGNNTQQINDIQ